jgi:hypothetical protein
MNDAFQKGDEGPWKEEGSEKQKRHYHHGRLPQINTSIMTCICTPSFAKKPSFFRRKEKS